MKKQEKKHRLEDVLINHLNDNFKQYILMCIIFTIGIIISVIIANNTQDILEKNGETTITNIIEELKNGYEIDNIALLKKIAVNHITYLAIMWFLGCSLIGIPIVYFLVLYKGFSLGYTISCIVITLGTGRGILFTIITLLLQNIILIPSTLILSVSGLNLYKSIIRNRKIENIKIEILRHTIVSLIILVAFMIATIIEVYVSNFILKMCVNYF